MSKIVTIFGLKQWEGREMRVREEADKMLLAKRILVTKFLECLWFRNRERERER